MALLRPSDLARLWGLHPKTVNGWIREGRLPAIKTPGAQYRVRTDDARAYCKSHGLPMPREVAAPAGSVSLIGKAGPSQRAIVRACRARGTAFSTWSNALEGLLAIASNVPDVIAIDASCTDVKVGDALRALRRTPTTAALPIVVYDAPPKSLALKQGATSLALRTDPEGAARLVLDQLEHPSPPPAEPV